MRSDDLVPLLVPGKEKGVGFRQGVVVSWDQDTAENTVLVGGNLMTNLPVLNTSEAALLSEGSVVSILTSGSTWGILGRMTIPGTPEAVTALSSLRTESATVTNRQSTTSTSFGDLATAGPSVTISVGATGRLMVIISATMILKAPDTGGIASAIGQMTFEMSGANTLAANNNRVLEGGVWYQSSLAGGFDTFLETTTGASKVYILNDLNPGATTLTAKYRSLEPSGSCEFSLRNITAMAI